MARYKLSAAILCGGQSTRMGFDKAMLRLGRGQGQYLLKIIANQLLERFSEVLLVTDMPEKLAQIGGLSDCRIVVDLQPRVGLVGAVQTAIHYCSYRGVFVLPCDMPEIAWSLLEYICDISVSGPTLLANNHDEKSLSQLGNYDAIVSTHDGFIEPLFSLYFRSAMMAFDRAVDEGEKTVRNVYGRLRVRYIDPQKVDLEIENINNVNLPNELDAFDLSR